VDNDFLNNRGKTPELFGYAVLGEVTDGMEVVDLIRAVKTGTKAGQSDVPVEPVTIISAKIVE
jgi:peptidyl-prolyl cis-trans isomerase B (cyclophilin B)